MSIDPLPFSRDVPIQAREEDGALHIEVSGDVFGHEGLAVVRRLCGYIEAAPNPSVVLALPEVNFFCTSALGRLAQCIAALHRDERELAIHARDYAYRSLLAIGLDTVIPIVDLKDASEGD